MHSLAAGFILFFQGTGIRLGASFLAAVSVVMTLIICFTSSWELSFILMLAFPLIFFSYYLNNKLYYSSGTGEYLETSTHVVTETVGYIKTVITRGAEDYFVRCIGKYLLSHLRYAQ